MPMRTVVAVAAAALAGVIAASALASCDVSVGALQHRTRSYSVATKVHVLVVHAEAGAVNVIGSAATKVSVTERISFRQSPPTTRHGAVAGTLTLDSRCPALETCSVSYYITVPRATTVRIYDDVGSIHLESLSGPTPATSTLNRCRGRSRLPVTRDRSSARTCHPRTPPCIRRPAKST